MTDNDSPENSTQTSDNLPQGTTPKNHPDQTQTPNPTSESFSSPNLEAWVVAYGYQGPLPSPETLQEFDRVLPGLAREIVDRADREMSHRHSLEAEALRTKVGDQASARMQYKRGQWMGFVLALGFLIAGVSLTLLGHPAVGATIATTTVVSLVAIFVTGRVTAPQSRNTHHEKQEE